MSLEREMSTASRKADEGIVPDVVALLSEDLVVKVACTEPDIEDYPLAFGRELGEVRHRRRLENPTSNWNRGATQEKNVACSIQPSRAQRSIRCPL